MSTTEGILKVARMIEEGWVYAGGNYDHHIEYHYAFVRDNPKAGICPDYPDIPGACAQRKKPFIWYEQNDPCEWTTCVCNHPCKKLIFAFHPDKGYEWVGSECRKKVEIHQKMCGECGKPHTNIKKVNGIPENRCDECRALAKEKAKKKKIRRCEDCFKDISHMKKYCKQCKSCWWKSRQNESLND